MKALLIAFLVFINLGSFAQSPQEAYVKQVLTLVKQGNPSNNYNLKLLNKEIYSTDFLVSLHPKKEQDIRTFTFNNYQILKSTKHQVTVQFKSVQAPFKVPRVWDTKRTFHLIPYGKSFQLKPFTDIKGDFLHIRYYEENKINYKPDVYSDYAKTFSIQETGRSLYTEAPSIQAELLAADLSSLFLAQSESLEGAIGGYKRLQMHYNQIQKQEKTQYTISGLSKASGNICHFSGKINIVKVLKFKEIHLLDQPEPSKNLEGGLVVAEVQLNEDLTQKGAGSFKGTLCTYWYRDSQSKEIKLYEFDAHSDGYRNQTFVGLWRDGKTNKPQKAIWGIGRLPYTEDLDIGTAETFINKKYYKNGWNERSEDWWK